MKKFRLNTLNARLETKYAPVFIFAVPKPKEKKMQKTGRNCNDDDDDGGVACAPCLMGFQMKFLWRVL